MTIVALGVPEPGGGGWRMCACAGVAQPAASEPGTSLERAARVWSEGRGGAPLQDAQRQRASRCARFLALVVSFR